MTLWSPNKDMAILVQIYVAKCPTQKKSVFVVKLSTNLNLTYNNYICDFIIKTF